MVSLDYWIKFLDDWKQRGLDYIKNRGKEPDDLTIERPDSRLGYMPGNMEILTKRENSIKSLTERGKRRPNYGYEPDIDPF
jgi:hypothetical protein